MTYRQLFDIAGPDFHATTAWQHVDGWFIARAAFEHVSVLVPARPFGESIRHRSQQCGVMINEAPMLRAAQAWRQRPQVRALAASRIGHRECFTG